MNFVFSSLQREVVDALILAGHKIHAIKQVRAYTGCDLKEGVELCNEREAHLRQTSPKRFATTNEEVQRLLEESGASDLFVHDKESGGYWMER